MTIGIIIGIIVGLALAYTLGPLFAGSGKKKTQGLNKGFAAGAVLVLAAAGGLYYLVGRPDLAQPPQLPGNIGDDLFAPQGGDQLPSIDIMVEQLKARLQEDPADIEGWSLLGQSFLILGRFDEAVEAYQRAVTIAPENPDLHSALGEALTLQGEGTVSEAAMLSFQNALKLDPTEPISRFYMGDYAFQNGDIQLAYDRWSAVYEDIPPETPWISLLEQRLGEAASQLGLDPPAQKLAALPDTRMGQDIQQMDEADQKAMIEGMVASLAARLEDNPNDMEGWARLGRSYMVLGRFEEGAAAYKNIADARPDDLAAQAQYAEALLTHLENEGRPVSAEALSVLTKIEQMDATNPTALFYLGQAAFENGDEAAAKNYWTRLLSLVDPTSPEAERVKEKLEGLG